MQNQTLRRSVEELNEIYGADAVTAELDLEDQMVTIGHNQIMKQITAARQAGQESSTMYGQSLVATAIDTVSGLIAEFKDKATQGGAGRRHIAVKYLKPVTNDVAAYIALRCVVDSLTGKKQLLQRVAINIGRRIEDEVRFTEFQNDNRKAYNKGLQKASKGTTYHRKQATMAGYERRFSPDLEWSKWAEQDALHVGMCLINMILTTDLITIADEIRSRRNTVKVIEPSEKLTAWIEREVDRSALMFPANTPMVVKPLPWTTPFDGGYLTKLAQGRVKLVKTSNQNYLSQLDDNSESMADVYDSLNALQDTAWRVNPSTYEVMRAMWEQGEAMAGLPSRDDIPSVPCPSCGVAVELPKLNSRGKVEHTCFDNEDVLRQWKKDAYVTHSANVALRSKRLQIAKALKIASTYVEYDQFYFPYQLDFRGRVYAIPSFNPQGNDTTKGLLEFSEGKPIEDGVAAGWLAIHGANTFGEDKLSLDDRIGWVEDHTKQINDCAADPLQNRWWMTADKPWQFLAFCFEWAEFCEQGFGFVSRTAVALDGSCSGIQHFSAMLLDKKGGSAVNLLPSELPSDIYQQVCDRVISQLTEDAKSINPHHSYSSSHTPPPTGEENKEEAIAISIEELAKGWITLQPNRKTTKRQVMTLPYGSTKFSCREYTEQWLKDVTGEGGLPLPWDAVHNFTATKYMSDLIWDAISDVVVAARQAMDWLQKCAKVIAKEELPVYWTTPAGFTVMQQYKQTSSRRVYTKLGEAILKLSLNEENNKIDKRRMANAISPNFVHSMDATHLFLSVCTALNNGVGSFAMIHDSFGTHAADTNMLAACIRETFVGLYTDTDVLEDFRSQIIRQVAPEDVSKIPPIPAKGDLDLDQVRSSDFFFA